MKRGITVRKLLICALALGGFAASAQAADLSVDSLKDPLPEKLSFAGVTVYGTVDVGYGWQSAGLPESSAFPAGLNYLQSSSAYTRPVSGLTNNAMSQSTIGVKVEEAIGLGFTAIAKADTGFNPLSGELSDGCKSLQLLAQSGAPHAAAYGDSSRCGQAFNGVAYAGLSNSSYGTLTVGRQQSLMLDGVANYDPQKGSYAFSPIGYSGTGAGGIGSTETARWDNSAKYVYQFGPAHAAAMYSSGGSGTALQNDAAYKGFALDAFYTKENGAVNAASATGGVLNALVTNNEAWSVMGKYTYDFGGSFKDDEPGAKLTFFAGYVHTDMGNPGSSESSYGNAANNGTTIGNYGFSTGLYAAAPFVTDKILQTEWAGASYATGPWTLTGAYYHMSQDAFKTTGTWGGSSGSAACVSTNVNCAGNLNWGSFTVDYAFNKHFDVYSGISYSQLDGGLASASGTAYPHLDNTSVVSGLRLKF
jgi:predicted porin